MYVLSNHLIDLEKAEYTKEKQLKEENEKTSEEPFEKLHLIWFPTVVNTLTILTKLYLSIDVYSISSSLLP